MRVLLTVIALCIFIGGACFWQDAHATQDATSAWNFAAASHNFDTTAEASSPYATFAQMYNGHNAQSDWAAISAAVNQAMGTHLPPGDMEDAFSEVLPYWPDA